MAKKSGWVDSSGKSVSSKFVRSAIAKEVKRRATETAEMNKTLSSLSLILNAHQDIQDVLHDWADGKIEADRALRLVRRYNNRIGTEIVLHVPG